MDAQVTKQLIAKTNKYNMKQLSLNEAASVIGVSSATIRNWTKAGHITSRSQRPLSFLNSEVEQLKEKLNSGNLQKLNKRANKSSSSVTFLPLEYADEKLAHTIRQILTIFHPINLDVNTTLYIAALRILELQGDVVLKINSNIFDLDSFHSWKRDSIKNEIVDWHSRIKVDQFSDEYKRIYFSVSVWENEDFLGLLYQSLLLEGEKSNRGSYFTASKIVDDSLDGKIGSEQRFMDPCCGAGKYLVHAAKTLHLKPNNIYGFDTDELAVRIARVNFLLTFRDYDFSPNIYCLDALTELATGEFNCPTNHLSGSFDFIATNPPWGAYKNNRMPEKFAHGVKSGESFSLFLAKSLSLLKPEGQLSFILPESILKIKSHSDIRKILLDQCRISVIEKLGRKFTGVFTETIRLDAIKSKPDTKWLVTVKENGKEAHVEQSRFTSNGNYTFDVDVKPEEVQLLNKIFSVTHTTMLLNADWALGIVTGDNKKHVMDAPREGSEAVYRGSDVHQFTMGPAKAFINFEPNAFQQVAQEYLYRAKEKLIYRFISRTLIVAYDNRQSLTLNSANIVIPRIPGLSIKVVLAFLNSSVLSYVFQKRHFTHKVLRGDLEKLPFPTIDNNTHKKIEGLVDSILNGVDKRNELNRLIFSAYQLDEDDISFISSELRS